MDDKRPSHHINNSGWVGDTLGYKDYCFEDKHVLYTYAFSTTTVATMINNSISTWGGTELDDKAGHNYKMRKEHYQKSFTKVLVLPPDSCGSVQN